MATEVLNLKCIPSHRHTEGGKTGKRIVHRKAGTANAFSVGRDSCFHSFTEDSLLLLTPLSRRELIGKFQGKQMKRGKLIPHKRTVPLFLYNQLLDEVKLSHSHPVVQKNVKLF